VIAEKSDTIARVLDLPERGFDGFLGMVMNMRSTLGIPHSLADIGVNAANSSVIGHEASIDPSAGGNPIPINASQLEQIFLAAVAGKLGDVVSAT
jgi:alcohol dehydrogenase class IV